jgi:hypothetical protein
LNIQPGDRYVVFADQDDACTTTFTAPALFFNAVDNVTLTDVTIENSPDFGIRFFSCMNIVVRDCVVQPTAGLLIGSKQDGIYLSHNMGPTVIKDCLLDHVFDDSITVEGRSVRVTEPATQATYVVADGYSLLAAMYATGDFTIDVYQGGSQACLGTFVVDPVLTIIGYASSPANQCPGSSGTGDKLVFAPGSPSLTTVCGDWVVFNCLRQTGFEIHNNRIIDGRQRGIIVAAGGGSAATTSPISKITQNTIDGATGGGIHIGADVGGPNPYNYGEDGMSSCHRINIANNVVQDSNFNMYQRLTTYSVVGAAVAITQGHFGTTWPIGRVHTNINVTNNVIANNALAGLFAGSCKYLAIEDNLIANNHLLTNGVFGSSVAVIQPYNASLIVQDTDSLTLANNIVEDSSAQPFQHVTHNVTNPSPGNNNGTKCHATCFEAYEFESPCPTCGSNPSTHGGSWPASFIDPSFLRLTVPFAFYPATQFPLPVLTPPGVSWTATISTKPYLFNGWSLVSAPYSTLAGNQIIVAGSNGAYAEIQGLPSITSVAFYMASSDSAGSLACNIDVKPAGGTWTTINTFPTVGPAYQLAPKSFGVTGLPPSSSYDLRFQLSAPAGSPHVLMIDSIRIDH